MDQKACNSVAQHQLQQTIADLFQARFGSSQHLLVGRHQQWLTHQSQELEFPVLYQVYCLLLLDSMYLSLFQPLAEKARFETCEAMKDLFWYGHENGDYQTVRPLERKALPSTVCR